MDPLIWLVLILVVLEGCVYVTCSVLRVVTLTGPSGTPSLTSWGSTTYVYHICYSASEPWGFLGGSVVWISACQCRRCMLDSQSSKIPWIRKWQPTPVFLPGKSHGQRSLEDYSPWGHRVKYDCPRTTTSESWQCESQDRALLAVVDMATISPE